MVASISVSIILAFVEVLNNLMFFFIFCFRLPWQHLHRC